MGFEPTPLVWKTRILASILMVRCVDSESSLLLRSQDKTFYKAVISASTYYTVKLIHVVLRSIDLICQPNFSVSYELTDFHISCFYKPEKES